MLLLGSREPACSQAWVSPSTFIDTQHCNWYAQGPWAPHSGGGLGRGLVGLGQWWEWEIFLKAG